MTGDHVEQPQGSEPDTVEAEMWRVCSLLETIAKTYAADSPENLAIRDAALAYTHACFQKEFLRLRIVLSGKPLSDAMKADCRRYGVDPDTTEAELDIEMNATLRRFGIEPNDDEE